MRLLLLLVLLLFCLLLLDDGEEGCEDGVDRGEYEGDEEDDDDGDAWFFFLLSDKVFGPRDDDDDDALDLSGVLAVGLGVVSDPVLVACVAEGECFVDDV